MIQTPKQHSLFITLHVLDIDCFPPSPSPSASEHTGSDQTKVRLALKAESAARYGLHARGMCVDPSVLEAAACFHRYDRVVFTLKGGAEPRRNEGLALTLRELGG